VGTADLLHVDMLMEVSLLGHVITLDKAQSAIREGAHGLLAQCMLLGRAECMLSCAVCAAYDEHDVVLMFE
jgi:hypothetical protein